MSEADGAVLPDTTVFSNSISQPEYAEMPPPLLRSVEELAVIVSKFSVSTLELEPPSMARLIPEPVLLTIVLFVIVMVKLPKRL